MEEIDNIDYFSKDCLENAAKHIQPVPNTRPFPGICIPIYPHVYYHNNNPFDRKKSLTLDLSKFPRELRNLHKDRDTAFNGSFIPLPDMKAFENYDSSYECYNLTDSLGSKTCIIENDNDDSDVEIIEVDLSGNTEDTLETIKEKMFQDNDSDIVEMSKIVTLKCPLHKRKMQLPIKGVNCSHLQCFEHTPYLMMNLQKPEWKCPICRRFAFYQDLRINRLLLEIIVQAPSECTEVQFNRDGSWIPVISRSPVNIDSPEDTK